MRFDRTFRAAAGGAPLALAILAGATTATILATHPAAAAAVLQAVENSVTCSSGSACFLATNSSTGPGVSGTSSKGIGMQGKGVTGVKGIATTSGNGYGLYGATTSGNGTGVYGISASNFGVEAQSSGGYALYADAYGSGTAAYLSADSGGYGLISYSTGNVAIYGQNSNGNGADVNGTYIGLVGRAPTNGFPLVATDQNGNDLFYVDGSGNVSYHGGLFKFARVPGGALVKSFSPNTTAPTVEDTGTAQLVNGAATVRLDPTFAASIDAGSSYRVFVTPGGDTHGLYVPTKTANGFIVRESQGGRSSVAFDYRIVATAAGQAGQRMAVANAALEPHALAPNAPRFKSTPPLHAAP